jgi:hypothetical protein
LTGPGPIGSFIYVLKIPNKDVVTSLKRGGEDDPAFKRMSKRRGISHDIGNNFVIPKWCGAVGTFL